MQLGKLNYQDMMNNKSILCSKEVSDLYDELNKQYRYMINMKDEYADNMRYIACKIRDEFGKFGYSDETITDMLVEYLYGKDKRYKQLLWFCYGQYIVNNLEKNVEVKKTKFIQCIDCGEWFEVDIKNNETCRCSDCNTIHQKVIKAEQNKRAYEKRKLSRSQQT